MATPSPKKRKTSPTTSLPIQAPTTPSRIPVPRQDARSIRPSFASPTKASLSRHNPQLLPRPSSSGINDQRPASRGNLFGAPGADGGGGDVQLEEPLRTSIENANNHPKPPGRAASQPLESRSVRSIGRSMSAKPRRMSRSPSKSPSKPVNRAVQGNTNTFGDNSDNPFQKRGLRRSPQGPSAEQPHITDEGNTESEVYNISNPFRKTGLRRSPIQSQEAAVPAPEQDEEEVNTALTKPGLASPVLGESPVQSQNTKTTPDIQQHIDSEAEMRLVKSSQAEFTGRTLRRSPIAPVVSQSSEVIPATQDDRQEEPAIAAVASPQAPRDSFDFTAQTQVSNAQEEVSRASPIEPELPPLAEPIEKEQVSEPEPEVEPEPEPEPSRPTPSQQSMNPLLTHRQRTVSPSPVQRLFGPRIVEPALPAAAYIQEEPELPLTPRQRGLSDPVVTTPPSGIHNTPSKRARRNKSLGARLKSSPLKPQPQRSEEPIKESVHIPAPGLQPGKPSQRRRSARFLPPLDPNEAKRKERDALFQELQQLKADVTLTNRENERIRKVFESGKSVSSAPKNVQELTDLLLRSMKPNVPLPPKPKPRSSFPDIQSFLPFFSKRRAQPLDLSILEKPLPSYLPVSLEDPLPYLQVFAPLSYTSDISILPNVPSSSNIDDSSFLELPPLQRHHISARSQSGLFAAKLAMTVNTSNLTVTSIEIEKLDRNAEAELGNFIRKRLSDVDEDIEYTLGRDITVVCWAMGRWVEVSVLRARLWCAIELELGTPEARKDSIQKASRKRKRKRVAAVDEEVAADLANNTDESGLQRLTRRQLLPHMGRTAIEITDEASHIEVRFEWRIDFDWTGEVESSISATARMPKHWQQEDDRRSLSKISDTFDRMVMEMGPLGAMRALVGLLMPS